MTEYRVYRLDGVTGRTTAESIEAETDGDVVDRVRKDMRTTVRCEIWLRNRVVKRLKAALPQPGKSSSS